MRPSVRLLSSALCAAVLSATGCRDTTGPADGLRVTTTVDLAEIRAGQAATVTTTVLNAGSRTRRVYGAGVCEGPFMLTTSDGTVLPTALDPCYVAPIAVPPAEVAPGRQLVFTSRLTGDARTAAASARYTVVAPPGEYALRGYVNAVGQDQGVRVTAPPVTIRILP